MFKLRRFLKDYKKECIIGPLCKLFEAILELFVPLVMANIINVGIVELHDGGYVLRMSGLLVLLAALGWTSAMFTQYFASRASQGAGTKIRAELYRHINSLSHAELDRLGTPSLITRVTNDTNQVQQSIAMMIRLLTRAPFIIAGSLVMAMTINLKMSLIFFAASLLIALTLYLVMSRSLPIFTLVQKKLDRIGLLARENLSGSRVIRAFSKQKTECERVDRATEDLAKTSVRVSMLSALLSPVTYAVTCLAIIAILWFGALNVNAGEMQTGDIVALVSYMTQILLAMVVVANLVILMTRSSACAKRIPGCVKRIRSVVVCSGSADSIGQVMMRSSALRYASIWRTCSGSTWTVWSGLSIMDKESISRLVTDTLLTASRMWVRSWALRSRRSSCAAEPRSCETKLRVTTSTRKR